MRFSLFALMAGLLLLVNVTYADPLSGCGTCAGMTYTLQYDPSKTTTSGADTVYDVFLLINTSGYTGASTDVIKTATIKISNSVDVPPSSLVSAPGGVGVWSFQIGGQNSSGCNGSGAGFICAADSTHAPTTPATTYVWEFHYATTSALLTGSLQSDIKSDFYDSTGTNFQGQLSNGITLQTCSGTTCGGGTTRSGGDAPEPASMLLFSTVLGLTGLGFRKLRRAS